MLGNILRARCTAAGRMLSVECLACTAEKSPEPRPMDTFLDLLFDGLKPLEGRLIPKGWSARIVLASVLCFAVLLIAIAFILI
jgi:hypothetical protein